MPKKAIDWEQRFYELVRDIYSHQDESISASFSKAETIIKMLKERNSKNESNI